jgi:hypothetical protein
MASKLTDQQIAAIIAMSINQAVAQGLPIPKGASIDDKAAQKLAYSRVAEQIGAAGHKVAPAKIEKIIKANKLLNKNSRNSLASPIVKAKKAQTAEGKVSREDKNLAANKAYAARLRAEAAKRPYQRPKPQPKRPGQKVGEIPPVPKIKRSEIAIARRIFPGISDTDAQKYRDHVRRAITTGARSSGATDTHGSRRGGFISGGRADISSKPRSGAVGPVPKRLMDMAAPPIARTASAKLPPINDQSGAQGTGSTARRTKFFTAEQASFMRSDPNAVRQYIKLRRSPAGRRLSESQRVPPIRPGGTASTRIVPLRGAARAGKIVDIIRTDRSVRAVEARTPVPSGRRFEPSTASGTMTTTSQAKESISGYSAARFRGNSEHEGRISRLHDRSVSSAKRIFGADPVGKELTGIRGSAERNYSQAVESAQAKTGIKNINDPRILKAIDARISSPSFDANVIRSSGVKVGGMDTRKITDRIRALAASSNPADVSIARQIVSDYMPGKMDVDKIAARAREIQDVKSKEPKKEAEPKKISKREKERTPEFKKHEAETKRREAANKAAGKGEKPYPKVSGDRAALAKAVGLRSPMQTSSGYGSGMAHKGILSNQEIVDAAKARAAGKHPSGMEIGSPKEIADRQMIANTIAGKVAGSQAVTGAPKAMLEAMAADPKMAKFYLGDGATALTGVKGKDIERPMTQKEILDAFAAKNAKGAPVKKPKATKAPKAEKAPKATPAPKAAKSETAKSSSKPAAAAGGAGGGAPKSRKQIGEENMKTRYGMDGGMQGKIKAIDAQIKSQGVDPASRKQILSRIQANVEAKVAGGMKETDAWKSIGMLGTGKSNNINAIAREAKVGPGAIEKTLNTIAPSEVAKMAVPAAEKTPAAAKATEKVAEKAAEKAEPKPAPKPSPKAEPKAAPKPAPKPAPKAAPKEKPKPKAEPARKTSKSAEKSNAPAANTRLGQLYQGYLDAGFGKREAMSLAKMQEGMTPAEERRATKIVDSGMDPKAAMKQAKEESRAEKSTKKPAAKAAGKTASKPKTAPKATPKPATKAAEKRASKQKPAAKPKTEAKPAGRSRKESARKASDKARSQQSRRAASEPKYQTPKQMSASDQRKMLADNSGYAKGTGAYKAYESLLKNKVDPATAKSIVDEGKQSGIKGQELVKYANSRRRGADHDVARASARPSKGAKTGSAGGGDRGGGRRGGRSGGSSGSRGRGSAPRRTVINNQQGGPQGRNPLNRFPDQQGAIGALKNNVGQLTQSVVTAQVIGKVGAIISQITGGLIGFNMKLEESGVAFKTLFINEQKAMGQFIGDGEVAQQKADILTKQLIDFANVTPFRFPDLVTSAERMKAFGFATRDILPSLQGIGDAVAALGGEDDKLRRITYALGQMKQAGRVYQNDMMQLSNAGIAGYEIIAKGLIAEFIKTGKVVVGSAEGIYEHSAGNITQVVNDIVKNAGQGAYKIASAQSEKFSGIYEQLVKDPVQMIRTFTKAGNIDGEAAAQVIINGLSETYGGGMRALSRTMQGAISTFADTSQYLIATAFKPIYEDIKKVIYDSGQFMMGPGGKSLAESVATAIEPVGDSFFAILPKAQSGIASVFRAISTAGKKLKNAMSKIIVDGKPILSFIFDRLSKGLAAISEIMSNRFVQAIIAATGAFKVMMMVVRANPFLIAISSMILMFGQMTNSTNKIKEAAKKGILPTLSDDDKQNIKNVREIQNSIASMGMSIKRAAKNLGPSGSKFFSTLATSITKVAGAITSGGGKILEKFINVATSAIEKLNPHIEKLATILVAYITFKVATKGVDMFAGSLQTLAITIANVGAAMLAFRALGFKGGLSAIFKADRSAIIGKVGVAGSATKAKLAKEAAQLKGVNPIGRAAAEAAERKIPIKMGISESLATIKGSILSILGMGKETGKAGKIATKAGKGFKLFGMSAASMGKFAKFGSFAIKGIGKMFGWISLIITPVIQNIGGIAEAFGNMIGFITRTIGHIGNFIGTLGTLADSWEDTMFRIKFDIGKEENGFLGDFAAFIISIPGAAIDAVVTVLDVIEDGLSAAIGFVAGNISDFFSSTFPNPFKEPTEAAAAYAEEIDAITGSVDFTAEESQMLGDAIAGNDAKQYALGRIEEIQRILAEKMAGNDMDVSTAIITIDDGQIIAEKDINAVLQERIQIMVDNAEATGDYSTVANILQGDWKKVTDQLGITAEQIEAIDKIKWDMSFIPDDLFPDTFADDGKDFGLRIGSNQNPGGIDDIMDSYNRGRERFDFGGYGKAMFDEILRAQTAASAELDAYATELEAIGYSSGDVTEITGKMGQAWKNMIIEAARAEDPLTAIANVIDRIASGTDTEAKDSTGFGAQMSTISSGSNGEAIVNSFDEFGRRITKTFNGKVAGFVNDAFDAAKVIADAYANEMAATGAYTDEELTAKRTAKYNEITAAIGNATLGIYRNKDGTISNLGPTMALEKVMMDLKDIAYVMDPGAMWIESVERAIESAKIAADRIKDSLDPILSGIMDQIRDAAEKQFAARIENATRILEEQKKAEEDAIRIRVNGMDTTYGMLQQEIDAYEKRNRLLEIEKSLISAKKNVASAALGSYGESVDPLQAAIARREAEEAITEAIKQAQIDRSKIAIDNQDTTLSGIDDTFQTRIQVITDAIEAEKTAFMNNMDAIQKALENGEINGTQAIAKIKAAFTNFAITLPTLGHQISTSGLKPMLDIFEEIKKKANSYYAQLQRIKSLEGTLAAPDAGTGYVPKESPESKKFREAQNKTIIGDVIRTAQGQHTTATIVYSEWLRRNGPVREPHRKERMNIGKNWTTFVKDYPTGGTDKDIINATTKFSQWQSWLDRTDVDLYKDVAKRAKGGRVKKGSTYLTGELGPELITMGSNNGEVISNFYVKRLTDTFKKFKIGNPAMAPKMAYNMGGGGKAELSVTINNPQIRSDSDIDKIVDAVNKSQMRMARRLGYS